MCTAISDNHRRHLFGRTLDLERSYGEELIVTPRAFPLKFKYSDTLSEHFAMIGIGHICNGEPLYYDAVNEKGLAVAALNFPQSTVYRAARQDKRNLASFELIPFLLGTCESVCEAAELLEGINITPDSFNDALPASPLHWLVADKSRAVVLESTSEGLKIYENPVGVLSNEPPFPYHLSNLANYISLGPEAPENKLCPSARITLYSRGMGAIGLPGDLSSASRFVRAVFAKNHTLACESEISRFFHIMDTVSQPLGCAILEDGRPICTLYTSCADTERGIYYFTTYDCRRIRSMSLRRADISSDMLSSAPIYSSENIENLI
ncbi:MAG: choloylglycine hydrolase [Clostridia bacterium]|nr:choloylglycine hydrolase [Clostridia bacterium]